MTAKQLKVNGDIVVEYANMQFSLYADYVREADKLKVCIYSGSTIIDLDPCFTTTEKAIKYIRKELKMFAKEILGSLRTKKDQL